jgi:GT2 family glycosyltransferase
VISVPNVQHHSVIRDLLGGRFPYVPAGILDQTHLRFFTRASLIELVRRAGLVPERIIPLCGTRERRAVRRGQAPEGLPIAPKAVLEDLYAGQFIAIARAGEPPPDTRNVRVSIVMLTFNRLDVTQQAIASLRASTQQPYELIVVDNGSTDETRTYLDRLERDGVRVIRNAENRGVAAGWNQGLRAATGDCLMVLNNDVLVSGDWLERLTRTAYALPRAGLMGCRANAISGPQYLESDYKDPRDLPLFARRYAELTDATWFELPRIAAVAMLWRRDVYERIGEFDEQFRPAGFEDDDYSMRALQAGYRNVVVNDVFIHHVGSASHVALATSVKAIGKQNGRRFLAKWGSAGAPVLALRFARYDEHIALLAPEQYVLPGWAVPDVPPRVVARYLAKVGRRLGRYGWRTESLRVFRRSLRTAFTVGGVTGFVWNARPRLSGRAGSAPQPP